MNRRLGSYLSGLTKPELEGLRELLNLTEDEEKVFDCLSKGKSKVQTSDQCLLSVPCIDKKIKKINEKLNRLNSI
jgi:DNA-binding CsgD family transcriptional regulator